MLRRDVYTMAISAVVLLLGLILEGSSTLTVTTPQAVVRAGPSTRSPLLSRVPLGGIFTITAAREDWYQVRLADGRQGWMNAAHGRVVGGALAVAADTTPRVLGATSLRRTALVIGNAAYPTGPLQNAVNDSTDMAMALKQLGFEVMSLRDANRREMEEAVETFSQKLRRGSMGLFYYAGHGVQIGGENYLMPIDARIKREQDVKYEAVPVGRVLGGMEDAGNDINIVILDACRDNPFARSFRSSQQSGLAVVQAARGLLIAYATSPGAVAADGTGRNSFYTEHLLQAITVPGLGVEQVFKQVRTEVTKVTGGRQIPWESSSLIGDFYFLQKGPVSPPAPVEAPKPPVQDVPPVASARNAPTGPEPEAVMWSLIEHTTNPEDVQEFLHAFPNSRLAPVARLKLRQLQRQQAQETKVVAKVTPPEEPKVAVKPPPQETKVPEKSSAGQEVQAPIPAAQPMTVKVSPPEEAKAATKVPLPPEPKAPEKVSPTQEAKVAPEAVLPVAAKVSPAQEARVPAAVTPPVAAKSGPAQETRGPAEVAPPMAPKSALPAQGTGGAAKVAIPEEPKAAKVSPLEETKTTTQWPLLETPKAPVQAPPPPETKVATRVLPPVQPSVNRAEVFNDVLNFEALDLAKLQRAICAAANTVRARRSLPELSFHPLLAQAADAHAQRMVSRNFFAQEDPYDSNLRTSEQRVRRVGVTNPYVHQNIAQVFGIQYKAGEPVYVVNKGKGLFSRTPGGQPIPQHTYHSFAETVLDQWLASPDVSVSILSRDVVQMGCGVAFYWEQGFPTFKVVQLYQYYAEIEP